VPVIRDAMSETDIEAIALYRSLGFTDAAPHCHSPMAGTLHFSLELQAA
jgi:hypothetical protein